MPPLCKEATKIKELIKFPLVAIDITEISFSPLCGAADSNGCVAILRIYPYA